MQWHMHVGVAPPSHIHSIGSHTPACSSQTAAALSDKGAVEQVGVEFSHAARSFYSVAPQACMRQHNCIVQGAMECSCDGNQCAFSVHTF